MAGADARGPRLREAASMVRAMKACCPAAGAPPDSVLRFAAWHLRLELPGVLRARDARRLASIGLKPDYVAALLRSFSGAAATRVGHVAELLSTGLSTALAVKAHDQWGADAAAAVRADPYGTVHALGGTLADADAVAGDAALGDAVVGHARWALLVAKRQGHTMLPTASLVARLRTQHPAASVDDIRQALADGVGAGRLAVVGPPLDDVEGIADPEVARVEAGVATDILKRAREAHLGDVDLAGSGLTDEQVVAARAVSAASLSVLTGGPGTGKSTVVRALVRALGEDRCLLTAPTGRAARNVGGNTVHSASGGRLLRRRPLQETTRADVPDDLLLMVVDEASMLTTELMVGVLSLAPPTCHVVLVGDADQLPPVGPGAVLQDLLDSGAVPVGRLLVNHRCGDGIQRLAEAVRAGDVAAVQPGDGVELVDVDAAPDSPTSAACVAVAEAVRHRAQVLTPHNSAKDVLNRAVQAAVRPRVPVRGTAFMDSLRGVAGTLTCDDRGRATLAFPGRSMDLRIDEALVVSAPDPRHAMMDGDLVMALKNQNKKRLRPGEVSACNGDVGVLRLGSRPTVEFADGTSEFPKLDGWLSLAYAATVHKFQGSECDAVVISLSRCASSWDRTLLYTAITRARSRVVVLGTRQELRAAVACARPRRHSALRVLLQTAVT